MGTGESRSLEALPLRSATGAGKYVGKNVLLVACYFGAAMVGLTFAIPPGSATAVWPPSGIALGAVWRLEHGFGQVFGSQRRSLIWPPVYRPNRAGLGDRQHAGSPRSALVTPASVASFPFRRASEALSSSR